MVEIAVATRTEEMKGSWKLDERCDKRAPRKGLGSLSYTPA